MLHPRKDYQCIQPSGSDPPNIGEDEPVFLLRAKDRLAPETMEFWASTLEASDGDQATVDHVRAWAEFMRKWQRDNGSKLPDAPESVHEPT